jgi:hypothetical protein
LFDESVEEPFLPFDLGSPSGNMSGSPSGSPSSNPSGIPSSSPSGIPKILQVFLRRVSEIPFRSINCLPRTIIIWVMFLVNRKHVFGAFHRPPFDYRYWNFLDKPHVATAELVIAEQERALRFDAEPSLAENVFQAVRWLLAGVKSQNTQRKFAANVLPLANPPSHRAMLAP